MRRGSYHPDLQDFYSGLPAGTSRLENRANIGRTKRERGKQARRRDRVYARGVATGDGKGVYKAD